MVVVVVVGVLLRGGIYYWCVGFTVPPAVYIIAPSFLGFGYNNNTANQNHHQNHKTMDSQQTATTTAHTTTAERRRPQAPLDGSAPEKKQKKIAAEVEEETMLRIAVDAGGDGFCLSDHAAKLYLERKGIPLDAESLKAALFGARRDDPVLADIIEELEPRRCSKRVSGGSSEVRLVHVPVAAVRERGWRIEVSQFAAEGAEDVVERYTRWNHMGVIQGRTEGGLETEGCDPRFWVDTASAASFAKKQVAVVVADAPAVVEEERLFDADLFGAELASLLDGLQRVQDRDTASFPSGAPLVLAHACMFTRPTGRSWNEADALTLHYQRFDLSVHDAVRPGHGGDHALAAMLAPSQAHPKGLTTVDVRAMLHARYVAVMMMMAT